MSLVKTPSLRTILQTNGEKLSVFDAIMEQNKTDVVTLNGERTCLPADLWEYLNPAEVEKVLQNWYNDEYSKRKTQQYLDGVAKNRCVEYDTLDEYRSYMRQRVSELATQAGFEFKWTQHIEKLFEELTAYFGGFWDELKKLNPGFNTSRKWLLVVGPLGTGKTFLLSAFRANPYQSFAVRPAKDCMRLAKADADLFFKHMSTWVPSTNMAASFGQKNLALMVDDLGTEENIKDYGNAINVMQDLLELRYDKFKYHDGLNTIITTNLSMAQIGERYGGRVLDRMKENCNLYVIDEGVGSFRGG